MLVPNPTRANGDPGGRPRVVTVLRRSARVWTVLVRLLLTVVTLVGLAGSSGMTPSTLCLSAHLVAVSGHGGAAAVDRAMGCD
jgi:hypothetical protein